MLLQMLQINRTLYTLQNNSKCLFEQKDKMFMHTLFTPSYTVLTIVSGADSVV